MKIFTLILLLCAVVVANAADPVVKEFARVAKAPVIDGIVDDNDPWSEEKWMDLAFTKASSATTDASAKMQMLFSKDIAPATGYIYLVIEVQDETPNNDVAISNTYERDCNEIFFSMDTNASDNGGAYKAGSWQLRVQREHPDGANIDGNSHANTWSVAQLLAAEDFKWAVEASASAYTTELQLPVAIMQGEAAFDGKNFRFDIQMGDNTTGAAGGRTQQTYWNSAASDNQWKDTRDFGLVKVGDKVIATVGVKNVATAKGSAFVKNNMLNVNNVNGTVAIYDLKGTMMRKATINGKGSIDIADMKAGMYIVKGNDIAVKFVK